MGMFRDGYEDKIHALEKEKPRGTRRSGWGNRGDIEWTR